MRKNFKRKMAAMVLSAVMVSQIAPSITGVSTLEAVTKSSVTVQTTAGGTASSFEKNASLDLTRTASAKIGTENVDGGVAEIVAYNSDNNKAYVVNGQEGVLDVLPMEADGSFGESTRIQVQNLIDGFTYGDMTSVAVDTVNDRVAIALQAEDYKANGQVAILDYDGKLISHYETGVQPDMVTFTKDGKKVLTADEGEPREGYGDGTTDPAGSVTIVDLDEKKTAIAGFKNFDAATLAADGVLFNKVSDTIVPAETDLEPEYISVSDDGSKAYISLQEANAIAILDLTKNEITDVKSLGFIDYSKAENAIDLVSDGKYEAKNYENALGVRMPDGITTYEKDGKTYLVTANEGDAREWGTEGTAQYFINEAKATLTATDNSTAKKVRVLDKTVTAGLEDGKNYLFGGRSISIYNADTMELVYDSANNVEKKVAEFLPEYFNCSNDDTEIDSRSQKKGPEVESVTTGTIDGKVYAFAALERVGGVMVFDVTDPANTKYVNYINSRDFSAEVAGDVSPEGLAFIPANKSANKQPMVLAACEVSGTVAGYTISGEAAQDAVVLYSNDVHCAIDGYSSMAALSEEITEDGYRNIMVDAGDAIQGETIGSLTKGSAIVDLMNQTGYELAVPGNHEFDFKMDTFLNLVKEAKYNYLSANFKDAKTDKTVFDAYEIKNVGGKKVAFVGISTPESYTKSSPAYFQDENGNYIYSFCEDKYYETIQSAVDSAKKDGADYVVAVGHTGIEGTTDGWKATDIIKNTTGIDVYLDGHSHETIENATYKNKDSKDVTLSSTGSKFKNIGKLEIASDGTIQTSLVKVEDVKAAVTAETENTTTTGVKNAYVEVQKSIDAYNQRIADELLVKIGTTESELTVNDPATGTRRIRNQETNMGDFVADAYKTVTGADIALVNGGGIRASVAAGDVTRKSLMDVNPWSNPMCVIRATGQQIIDALEHGTRLYPSESGGFLQVSGISYEINKSVTESPVIVDDKNIYQSVDSSKKRRVQNVKVNGTAIDLTKTYTVAGTLYTLQEQGDGYNMFNGCEIVKKEELRNDAETLIEYFMTNLAGKVTTAQYGNAAGDGRIKVVDGTSTPTATPPAPTATATAPTPTATATATVTAPAPTATALPKATATVAPDIIIEASAEDVANATVQKASISSLKNVKGRKAKVKVKKISGVKGYTIQYSTSKKFTKKTTKSVKTTKTTYTIKKLKKKATYYVRVRGYKKNAADIMIYGKYSNMKKVKIKK